VPPERRHGRTAARHRSGDGGVKLNDEQMEMFSRRSMISHSIQADVSKRIIPDPSGLCR
jgi:hypothetical protein